jgi:amidase
VEDYESHDALGLAALIRRGETTADALLEAALERAEALNPRLNALVHLVPDTARRRIAEGLPDGPFTGVPFLLKDLGAEAVDFPASNGSRLLAGTRYPGDSHIYARLAAAGLVTFGRTTAPEGGVGVVTEAAVYGGPTRNPWALDRTPGGSSGGAGAAVAAGIVPAAHGSDGGGSVRIPASNCGLFGFKATRARLPDGPFSGEGWAGMAIDGFLTRSVRDTAALLDATAGPDLGAPYWAPPLAESFTAAIARPPRRLRIAFTPSATITLSNPFRPPDRGGFSPVFKGVCRMGANR